MKPSDIVRAICPRACMAYIQAFDDHADYLFCGYGVTTVGRMAHFLSQICHESGGLTIARENMRYTNASRILEIFGVGRHTAAVTPSEALEMEGAAELLAERVYGLGNPGKARELGNVQPGDGWRFRGGGLLQTTGRAAYRRYGARIGVDLESDPDMIVAPRVALLPALAEWGDGDCNAMADVGDIRGITRKINGGFNGLSDRGEWLKKVRAAMLQLALADIEFDVGRPDGVLGQKTAAALSSFQASRGLPQGGIDHLPTLQALGIDAAAPFGASQAVGAL